MLVCIYLHTTEAARGRWLSVAFTVVVAYVSTQLDIQSSLATLTGQTSTHRLTDCWYGHWSAASSVMLVDEDDVKSLLLLLSK